MILEAIRYVDLVVPGDLGSEDRDIAKYGDVFVDGDDWNASSTTTRVCVRSSTSRGPRGLNDSDQE